MKKIVLSLAGLTCLVAMNVGYAQKVLSCQDLVGKWAGTSPQLKNLQMSFESYDFQKSRYQQEDMIFSLHFSRDNGHNTDGTDGSGICSMKQDGSVEGDFKDDLGSTINVTLKQSGPLQVRGEFGMLYGKFTGILYKQK